MIKSDLVIIGAGPAGMAAAIEAKEKGVNNIIILEREEYPGGILQQCIHNGFGLDIFKEELTGPEYAQRFIEKMKKSKIQCITDTTVLRLKKNKKIYITVINKEKGLVVLESKAVVLAMGCREKTRGALNIPGTRPAGIYTAGTAQKLVNIEGYLPGKKVVILGSGDIGLIMARRLTLEGAEVKMVCEILSSPGGLTRNVVQCLGDFNIPLKLNHTVVNIHGKERLEGVTVARTNRNGMPVRETEQYVDCDTLLLSVGLIPENELSKSAGVKLDHHTGGVVVNEKMHTSVKGIFACGNVVHVNDKVDNVTKESVLAGKSAAEYLFERGV